MLFVCCYFWHAMYGINTQGSSIKIDSHAVSQYAHPLFLLSIAHMCKIKCNCFIICNFHCDRCISHLYFSFIFSLIFISFCCVWIHRSCLVLLLNAFTKPNLSHKLFSLSVCDHHIIIYVFVSWMHTQWKGDERWTIDVKGGAIIIIIFIMMVLCIFPT